MNTILKKFQALGLQFDSMNNFDVYKEVVMNKVHVIILLMICLMIFSGCQKQMKEPAYPKLDLPETGSVGSPDATYIIGDQLTDEMQKTQTILTYKFVAPDSEKIRQHLEEQFDTTDPFSNDGSRNYSASENIVLEIDDSNGFWTYTNKAIQENVYQPVPSRISKDESKSLAIDIAKIHEVDLDMYSDIVVIPVEYSKAPSENGTVSDPVEIAYEVYFYPVISGRSVYGLSRFVVSFDGDGNVAGIKKQYKDIVPYEEETTISLDEAVKKLEAGEVSINVDTIYEQAKITDYDIVYYADASSINEQPYLQPIYYLEGTVSGSEVGRYISKETGEVGDNSFTALVPALQNQ
jgi:hypothetical protein